MPYISRIVSPDEKLIGVFRLHWIYLVEALLWLIGLMAIGFFLDTAVAYALGQALPGVQMTYFPVGLTWLELFFLTAGLYIFAVYYIKVATTEIGLTTVRLIYKTGWIFVNVEEVNLEEVQAHHVDLGLLGRFLGYGQIRLDARFIGDVTLPYIGYPYQFTKIMNEAQSKLESHMSLVIDGMKGKGMHVTRMMPASSGNPEEDRPPQARPELPPSAGREVVEAIEEIMPAKVALAIAPPARPAKTPHPVAEGSYEGEKLKEELAGEWIDNVEEDESGEETYRPSRQLH